MISHKTRINNRLGLHARAAAKLVRLANEFKSDVRILKSGQSANAKNIMEVLMLGAAHDEELSIEAEGSDKENATKSVIKLIEDRFDELE